MLTINTQRLTTFPSEETASALASKLLADDPETDYRVIANNSGFFVAVFEDGTQVYSL